VDAALAAVVRLATHAPHADATDEEKLVLAPVAGGAGGIARRSAARVPRRHVDEAALVDLLVVIEAGLPRAVGDVVGDRIAHLPAIDVADVEAVRRARELPEGAAKSRARRGAAGAEMAR